MLQQCSSRKRWAMEIDGEGVTAVVDTSILGPLQLWSRRLKQHQCPCVLDGSESSRSRTDVSSVLLAGEAEKADGASKTTPRAPDHQPGGQTTLLLMT